MLKNRNIIYYTSFLLSVITIAAVLTILFSNLIMLLSGIESVNMSLPWWENFMATTLFLIPATILCSIISKRYSLLARSFLCGAIVFGQIIFVNVNSYMGSYSLAHITKMSLMVIFSLLIPAFAAYLQNRFRKYGDNSK